MKKTYAMNAVSAAILTAAVLFDTIRDFSVFETYCGRERTIPGFAE
jgi:hypothetical protein